MHVIYDVQSVTVADLAVSHYAHIEAIDYACNWDEQVRKTTLNPYTFVLFQKEPPRDYSYLLKKSCLFYAREWQAMYLPPWPRHSTLLDDNYLSARRQNEKSCCCPPPSSKQPLTDLKEMKRCLFQRLKKQSRQRPLLQAAV